MVKAPSGYLRKPASPGQVAPQVLLDVLAATETLHGKRARDALFERAGIGRLPTATDPIPATVAHLLHRTLRELVPETAGDILQAAGRSTADELMTRQLSTRGQLMLTGGPWTIAAWLLGRWAKQNSWTFAGAAAFTPVNALEFELTGNPLVAGETSSTPICRFHEALFERLFQRLVDQNLVCREIDCEATGASACRFVVALA
jgi:divinyl protochlorophyllide a 8-vinyl-reductase